MCLINLRRPRPRCRVIGFYLPLRGKGWAMTEQICMTGKFRMQSETPPRRRHPVDLGRKISKKDRAIDEESIMNFMWHWFSPPRSFGNRWKACRKLPRRGMSR